MIEVLGTGLVYRNPKPHLRAVHTWHPSLVLLDNGELLASFDLGQGAESLDYRTYLSRSLDTGLTWSPPLPLLEETTSPRSTHSLRISRTRAGAVLAFGGRFHRNDPEEGLVNRANLGYVPMDLLWMQSDDGGRTWGPPHRIEPPLVGPSFEICHGIVELRDGRWLAPTSTWKGWEGQMPNGMKAVTLVSHDQGHSWPEYIDIVDQYAQAIISWEQSLTELPDGRLLAVVWAFDENAGRSLPNPYTLSDDGRLFSPPRLTGLKGQTAKLLSLADGRVLCLYRRDDQPGLWANLACIDGEQWINLAEAPLWQGAGSGMTGKAAAGEELSGLKFGYPSMVRLNDGNVFALFWCCEDCINNIRWLRIRV
jgi:hypothetical protein